jgi:hypothetical protein
LRRVRAPDTRGTAMSLLRRRSSRPTSWLAVRKVGDSGVGGTGAAPVAPDGLVVRCSSPLAAPRRRHPRTDRHVRVARCTLERLMRDLGTGESHVAATRARRMRARRRGGETFSEHAGKPKVSHPEVPFGAFQSGEQDGSNERTRVGGANGTAVRPHHQRWADAPGPAVDLVGALSNLVWEERRLLDIGELGSRR